MAQFRNNTQNALRSVSFGSEQPERPHSVGRELNDLREDVELAFARMEAGVALPMITSWTPAHGFISNNTATLVGLKGINLLAGRAQATKTLGDLTLTSIQPGTSGNSLTIEVVVGAGALAATLTNGTDIKVTTQAAGDTWAAIKTKLDSVNTIAALVSIVDDAGGNSSTTAYAKSNLDGGTGDGLIVRMHGDTANGGKTYEDLTISAASDTSITLVASATAQAHISAAAITVSVVVISHNAVSNAISFVTT